MDSFLFTRSWICTHFNHLTHPLQSETCGLEIPEIDLLLQPGTLGGRFTTLEGILTQVYEELSDKVFLSGSGDSSKGGGAGNGSGYDMSGFEKFLKDLKAVSMGLIPLDRSGL